MKTNPVIQQPVKPQVATGNNFSAQAKTNINTTTAPVVKRVTVQDLESTINTRYTKLFGYLNTLNSKIDYYDDLLQKKQEEQAQNIRIGQLKSKLDKKNYDLALQKGREELIKQEQQKVYAATALAGAIGSNSNQPGAITAVSVPGMDNKIAQATGPVAPENAIAPSAAKAPLPPSNSYENQAPQMNGYQQRPNQAPQMNGYQPGPNQAPQMNGYQSGPNQAPQMNGYQSGPNQAPQMNGYQSGQNQAPQMNGYQSGQNQAPQMNGYQSEQNQAPQMNGYQPGPNQAPQMNGYQSVQNQTPQMNGYQAGQNQAPQTNGYQQRPNQVAQPNKVMDDEEYSETLDSIEDEKEVSRDVFAADGDEDFDVENSITYTNANLKVDISEEDSERASNYIDKNSINGRTICREVNYLGFIEDEYSALLYNLKLNESVLASAIVTKRVINQDGSWTLLMPSQMNFCLRMGFLENISEAISAYLKNNVLIDVKLVDEAIIDGSPTDLCNKYYAKLKAQRYNETLQDQNFQKIITELGLDLTNASFELVEDKANTTK